MGLSALAYTEVLVGSLPSGLAWRRDADSVMWKLLSAVGEELARTDARVDDLRRESSPFAADELLPDWEALVGLPDSCSPPAATLTERRAAVVERLAFLGDQSPAAYVALALAFGVVVTVFEPHPMRCGDLVESPMYGDPWHHTFFVQAPPTTVLDFLLGDPLGSPFRTFGEPLLECAVARKAPAHAKAFVTYGT